MTDLSDLEHDLEIAITTIAGDHALPNDEVSITIIKILWTHMLDAAPKGQMLPTTAHNFREFMAGAVDHILAQQCTPSRPFVPQR